MINNSKVWHNAVLTTSSPAFISTCGRTMNFESLLSGVVAFLRPDKPELRSRDVDRDVDLNPLERVGDRGAGEESFGAVFLMVLLELLSNEVEATLLEEDEEAEATDTDGFTDDLLEVTCLVTSESVDLLKLRSNGNDGVVDFLVSETVALLTGLVATEGAKLRLISGRDLLPGSAALFPGTATALVSFAEEATVDFSAKPPVLFRLTTGAELELCADPVRVDFFMLEAESELPLSSNFFLTEPKGTEAFGVTGVPDLTLFTTFFSLTDELTSTFFSAAWGFSAESSPGRTSGSSI